MVALISAGVAAAVVGGLVGVAESYLSNVISQDIVFQLRRELFERLIDQPVSFFTSTRSGNILSRLNNDVGGVESVVADTVFGMIRNALTTVATLALMFTFGWPPTLLVLALT